MDLLCTENIMHEYETEILCHHHHQQSFKAEPNQQQQILQQHQHHQQQHQQQQQQRTIASKSNTTPPSVYSSSSSLSSSSCSSTNSSGYNSSSSNSIGGSYHSAKLTCEESSNAYVQATSCGGPPTSQHLQQQQQQQQQQQHQQQQQIYQHKPTSPSNLYHDNTSSAQNVYANNLIARSLDYVNTATEDPTFLTDRCLENALKAEEKRPQPVCTYFKTVQKDITPPMRKIVAEWMMEVCAEEKCQEEVVLLALNYMDRFLSTKSVRKTHLQILAAACLLLASKLREPSCRALSAELLVFYTDNSIHKADLIKWELYVLSRLGWDLSCVTPLDFLELLLIRLPIRSNEYPDLDVDKVRQHAQAFISLAAKEHQFSMYTASTIAASSIAAALSGLNWHLRTGQNLRYLLNLLTDLTSVEQDYLHDCMMKMETIFEEHSRNLQPYLGSTEAHIQQQNGVAVSMSASNINSSTSNSYSTMPATTAVTQSQYSQNPQYHHYHAAAYQHPENRQFNHQHNPSHSHQHHIQQQQQQQQQHHHLHHNSQNHHSASSSSIASSASSLSSHEIVTGSVTANVLLPNLTQTCKMQANAQKEVQDIKF